MDLIFSQVPKGEPHSTLVRMCRVSSAAARPVFCVLRRNADDTVSGAVAFRSHDSRQPARCAGVQPRPPGPPLQQVSLPCLPARGRVGRCCACGPMQPVNQACFWQSCHVKQAGTSHPACQRGLHAIAQHLTALQCPNLHFRALWPCGAARGTGRRRWRMCRCQTRRARRPPRSWRPRPGAAPAAACAAPPSPARARC
jgi:hypothetical protein